MTDKLGWQTSDRKDSEKFGWTDDKLICCKKRGESMREKVVDVVWMSKCFLLRHKKLPLVV